MFTLIKIVGIKVKVAIQHVNRQCNLKQILLLSMYQQLDVAKSLGRLYNSYMSIKIFGPRTSIVSCVSIIFCTPLLVVKRNSRGYLG